MPKYPAPGELWKHTKTGNVYKVDSVGKLEKDSTLMVVYRTWYNPFTVDETPWIRPLAEFMGKIPEGEPDEGESRYYPCDAHGEPLE